MCNLWTAFWLLDALCYEPMRDVKDVGQQISYRSLEWNWPKEALNIHNY